MSSGPIQLFSTAVSGLLEGRLPGLLSGNLSAHLLGPAAEINVAGNETLADLQSYLISGEALSGRPLQGARLVTDADGNVSFNTDAIVFGSYLTTPPFRYLVFSFGLADAVPAAKPLLGYSDLSSNGGALEVVRDTLVFTPAVEGWFQINI